MEIEQHIANFIGEIDTKREGLEDTPKRVAKFYKEFLTPEPFTFTTFESEEYDSMIIQTGIPFYSLCEHHLLPFFGTATIAYLPNDRIVGLSKLARTIDFYSRRLQNQERITKQVADRLYEELDAKGVAVTLEARHLCMEMRGIKKPGAVTTTSTLLGLFRDNQSVRQEYLAMK